MAPSLAPGSESEDLFATYLVAHGLPFVRDHVVSQSGRNVDFFVAGAVYCDVKEVRAGEQSVEEINGAIITADRNIRNDIRKLREKFDERPGLPTVLVTMNFSDNLLAGFSMVTAMLGRAGWTFSKQPLQTTSPLHHLPRGNAALTQSSSTAVSGVLVFDPRAANHAFFSNPHAARPLPAGFFPGVRYVDPIRGPLDREAIDLTWFPVT